MMIKLRNAFQHWIIERDNRELLCVLQSIIHTDRPDTHTQTHTPTVGFMFSLYLILNRSWSPSLLWYVIICFLLIVCVRACVSIRVHVNTTRTRSHTERLQYTGAGCGLSRGATYDPGWSVLTFQPLSQSRHEKVSCSEEFQGLLYRSGLRCLSEERRRRRRRKNNKEHYP